MGRRRRRRRQIQQAQPGASPAPAAPQPAQDQAAPQTDESGPEAAPTNFRRNIWLLVVIIAVVAAAWLAGVIARAHLFGPPAP